MRNVKGSKTRGEHKDKNRGRNKTRGSKEKNISDDGGSGSGSGSDVEDEEDSEPDLDRLRTRKTAPDLLPNSLIDHSGRKKPPNSKHAPSPEKDESTKLVTGSRARAASRDDGKMSEIIRGSRPVASSNTPVLAGDLKKAESAPHNHRLHRKGEEKPRKPDQLSQKKYDTFDFDERKESRIQDEPLNEEQLPSSHGKHHTYQPTDYKIHKVTTTVLAKTPDKPTKKPSGLITSSDKPSERLGDEDKVSRYKSAGNIPKRRKSDFTPQRKIEPEETITPSSYLSKTKAKKRDTHVYYFLRF